MLLSVTEEALPKLKPDWDAVVVDEAQDLSIADRPFALELAKRQKLLDFPRSRSAFLDRPPVAAGGVKFGDYAVLD